MRHYENDCVGCPQGCVHCARERDYIVFSCDKCGDDATPIYDFNGKELCMNCIFKDAEPGECEICGANDDLIDGLCRECIDLDEVIV
jgi:hypothetical protein